MTKKLWIAASAVAVMMGLSSHGVMAQDNNMGMSMSSGIDYSVLAKPHAYDYMSLKQAKAAGYSDSQIATMVKIADRSDMNLTEVLAAVQRGETFPILALNANLRMYDVYNVDEMKAQIENYKTAYEHTGTSGMMMHDHM